MHKLTIILCVVIASCSKQPQVRTSEVVDERDFSDHVKLVSNRDGEIEQGAPPANWRTKVGQDISFVGTYEDFPKEFFYRGVRVGKHILDVRGSGIFDVPFGSEVRVTGVLQHVRHPGNPASANQQQQGSTSWRKDPWHEWFVDATKIEVLSKPE